MSAVECPNCASSVPAASRFCPECGRPLAETSSADSARSSWPPDAPLVVVVLVAVGGVILLVGGRWAWGLAVLLLAGLVFLSQREVERRAASTKLFALRDRLSAHREVVSARSRGQLDLFRARRELAELEADRARAFQNLGRAVFEDDETGIKGGRTALTGLVERITRKEAEIETLIQETDERVRRAQAHVVPTAKMESPPEPAPVPEPSPGDPAPTPEHPPMPETRAADRRR